MYRSTRIDSRYNGARVHQLVSDLEQLIDFQPAIVADGNPEASVPFIYFSSFGSLLLSLRQPGSFRKWRKEVGKTGWFVVRLFTRYTFAYAA